MNAKYITFKMRRDTQADIGIGTLIVFIAMVLVAAIAAAVLINTAGNLQQKATNTAQDVQDRISTNLQVKWVMGNVTNGAITELYLGVGPAPGTISINLTNIQMIYSANNVAKVLFRGNDPSPTTYGVNDQWNYDAAGNQVDVYQAGFDPDDAYYETTGKYILNRNGTLVFVINLLEAPTGINAPLSPATECELLIVPGGSAGIKTVTYFRTPGVYENQYIRLV